jgi:hypothetical protein
VDAVIPPTYYSVFRVLPGDEEGSVSLEAMSGPFASLEEAERTARDLNVGTLVVLKMTPVSVFRCRTVT